jgi:predicted SAM-dependent methyltransferase
LNIAAGTNVFPFNNWINYDCDGISDYLNSIKQYTNLENIPDYQKNLILYMRRGGIIDFRIHDLNKGFSQHEDNSVDLIYLGQMIEHLNYIYETPQFLKECYRMMKTGGVIRVTTPDLDLLIRSYINNQMDQFINEQPNFYRNVDQSAKLAMLMYGASGENCKRNNYEGHMFLYTKKSMTDILLNAGFSNIEFYSESGKSKNNIMAQECKDFGLSHSLCVEACKL